MQKTFCDLCEEPAPDRRSDQREKVLVDSVLCDDKAKITGSFILSFKGHSTGYGGSPDLCDKCYMKMMIKYQQKGKINVTK